MKPKIITILLLLIIAFSIVTLSGCWLLDNDSEDNSSNNVDNNGNSFNVDDDSGGGSYIPPADETLIGASFEDKLYADNEDIIIEVTLCTIYDKESIVKYYENNKYEKVDKEPYTKLYFFAYNPNLEFPQNEAHCMQMIKDSQLTVVHTVEEFCAENYPLYYLVGQPEPNKVEIKIPKSVFVEDAEWIGIYTLFKGRNYGFNIFYSIREDGIFISQWWQQIRRM